MTAGRARWRQPAPVCIALALLAHAAALWLPAKLAEHGRGSSRGSSQAVSARYVTELPAAPYEPAPAPSPAVGSSPEHASERAPAAAARPADTSPDAAPEASAPPTFGPDAPPMLANPDAPMPADGVRLRVFVQVATDGIPSEVTAGVPPGADTPAAGFQKVAVRALQEARFEPGSAPTYCFLVRFEAGTQVPQLAWLPGAARDAVRCLTGAQPTPRELPLTAAR